MAMTYAPGDPNTPSHLRTEANGWKGSTYVGGAAAPAPAPVAAPFMPAPVNTNTTQVQPNQQLPPARIAPSPDALAEATKNYWAPDREAELARLGGAAPAAAAPSAIIPGATGNTAASGNQPWLDWAQKTYGQSQSRGAGFADSGGVTLQDAINRYNAETGANAKYLGGSSKDKADFGAGEVDALTGEGQFWSSTGGPTGGRPTAAAGGGGGGGGSAAGAYAKAPGSTVNAAGGTTAPGFQDQVRAMLLAQMTKASQPVDANDPSIQAAMSAARLEADRGHDLTRKDQAERMYAEGSLNSNALGQAVQQGRERGATGLATLQGDLMGRLQQAKRQEMATLLQQALATGDAESARALQLKLGQMDEAIQRANLAQRGSQWNDSYGLQVADAERQRRLDAERKKAGLPF